MSIVVKSTKELEDCLDGSYIYELTYSSPITRCEIKHFENIGELDFFPDFPKPFYRVVIGDVAQIKGIENELSARLILFKGELSDIVNLVQA